MRRKSIYLSLALLITILLISVVGYFEQLLIKTLETLNVSQCSFKIDFGELYGATIITNENASEEQVFALQSYISSLTYDTVKNKPFQTESLGGIYYFIAFHTKNLNIQIDGRNGNNCTVGLYLSPGIPLSKAEFAANYPAYHALCDSIGVSLP